ncbi:hypothetical protein ACI2KR_08080 [Pseudomonas luteola]
MLTPVQDELQSRQAAWPKFLAFLERNGGTQTIERTAEMIGLGISEITEMLDTRKLIFITLRDGQRVIPSFQLASLENFVRVNLILKDSDGEGNCIFYLYPIMDEGDEMLTPAQILSTKEFAHHIPIVEREALREAFGF